MVRSGLQSTWAGTLLDKPTGSGRGTESPSFLAWLLILRPSHPSARCISKAWVCDGDSDCEDNSDEENCEALACRPPSHPCANNTSVCLPPDKLCDGKDDCGDGSDEGELCGEVLAGPGVSSVERHLGQGRSAGGGLGQEWAVLGVSPTMYVGLGSAVASRDHSISSTRWPSEASTVCLSPHEKETQSP